jgi:hypothetical protein
MRAFNRAISPLVTDRRTVDRTLLSVLRLPTTAEDSVTTRPDIRAA